MRHSIGLWNSKNLIKNIDDFEFVDVLFESLDAKLSAAVDKLLADHKNILAREVLNKNEEYARKRRKPLRGRQALWLVYDSLRKDEDQGLVFDMQDLQDVKLVGDNLESFWPSGILF